MTWAIAKLVGMVFPMRVSEEDEIEGLDYAAHGERAYDIIS